MTNLVNVAEPNGQLNQLRAVEPNRLQVVEMRAVCAWVLGRCNNVFPSNATFSPHPLSFPLFCLFVLKGQ